MAGMDLNSGRGGSGGIYSQVEFLNLNAANPILHFNNKIFYKTQS